MEIIYAIQFKSGLFYGDDGLGCSELSDAKTFKTFDDVESFIIDNNFDGDAEIVAF